MLFIDAQIGHKVAKTYFEGLGVDTNMPEDILPADMQRHSYEHLIYITLTVAIDYMRDANLLWANARKTFADEETRYLFNPPKVCEMWLKNDEKVKNDLAKHSLSKKKDKDAEIWYRISNTFNNRWHGDPLNFLKNFEWDALKILDALKIYDFPYLRGNKIAPLWIRMLRDNLGFDQMKNLDKVPIPVDIHVARASLCLGVVKGTFSGNLDDIFDEIRKCWALSVKGLKFKNREAVALDMDVFLWKLSKYGCTNRRGLKCAMISQCFVRDLCIKGKIRIVDDKNSKFVYLDTGTG